uniref:Uncharacterized protein n=1 Tax=Arundo donax TaxID=35708 RepID=A0A0A9E1K2_ARUDO
MRLWDRSRYVSSGGNTSLLRSKSRSFHDRSTLPMGRPSTNRWEASPVSRLWERSTVLISSLASSRGIGPVSWL